MPPPVEPVDGDGEAMQFSGGYSSVERSGVSYMFAPEADGPRPVSARAMRASTLLSVALHARASSRGIAIRLLSSLHAS